MVLSDQAIVHFLLFYHLYFADVRIGDYVSQRYVGFATPDTVASLTL